MSQLSSEFKALTPFTIFVACPGDCAGERGIVDDVAKELEALGNHHGYTLKVRNWTHLLPNVGRPQQVIFDQVPVKTWDVLVCNLWLRFGTKSGGSNVITGLPAESGTEEEFAFALESFKATGKPRILFYRRTAGPPDISRLEISQFNQVQEFFKKFDPGQPYEGLYKHYNTPEEFRKLLREHLQTLLINSTPSFGESLPTAVTTSDESIPTVVLAAWRERLLMTYDVLKLHRISSAYDAGSVLRADRDRVRLHDVFIPQHVCDVSAFVVERLPAPKDLANADADELRILGMQNRQELRRASRHHVNEIMDREKNHQIVVLGNPGAGKSSMLQHRALTWARDTSLAGPLPLLLEMRQYAARVARAREEKQPQPSLLEWAGELLGLSAGVLSVPEKVLCAQLSNGSIVLYCDALDEIFEADLRRATAEQLLQIAIKIPVARIVVTSRPVGYPDEVLGPVGFGHWLLQDFDKKQIKQFLVRWVVAALPDQDDRANVTSRMEAALEIRRVREMAGNPLLLTLMCILARTDELPRDRMRLYAKAAELLLYQWDTSRSLRPVEGLDFAYEQKHRVLRELAWRMQNAQIGLGGNLAPLEMVREVFDNELKADLDKPGIRARGVSLLLETLRERDHVLCHLGGDRFAFVHRGFLEFFCADWLNEKVRRTPSTAEMDLFEIFRSFARVAAWGEVLALGVLGLAPEVADPILARLDPVLTKRGMIPRWLSDSTLLDEKAQARYPKTSASLRQRVLGEIRSPNGSYVVSSLVNELARFWPDEEARLLLMDLVRNTKAGQKTRRAAIGLIARLWPKEEVRAILINVVMCEKGRVCRAALLQLAQRWPDDSSRSLLMEVINRGGDSKTIVSAIGQLALHWRDEDVRACLKRVAGEDDGSKVSLAASRQLELRWREVIPTDTTETI